MFKILYNISPEHLKIENGKITEIDIQYYLFPGDIQFYTPTGFFDMSWGWITVLDFAIFFKKISQTLSQQEYSSDQFGFTESEDVIDISRKKQLVELHLSFDNSKITVDFEEFCREVDRFYDSVLEEVLSANPFLRENKEFLKLVSDYTMKSY